MHINCVDKTRCLLNNSKLLDSTFFFNIWGKKNENFIYAKIINFEFTEKCRCHWIAKPLRQRECAQIKENCRKTENSEESV